MANLSTEVAAAAVVSLAVTAYAQNSVRYEFRGRAVKAYSPAALVKQVQDTRVWSDCPISEQLQAMLAICQRLDGKAKDTTIDLSHCLAISTASDSDDMIGWDTVEDLVRAGHYQSKRQVAIYGLGRVGRLMCRLAVTDGLEPACELVAIVVRPGDLAQRLQLLQRDSIQGDMPASAEIIEREGRTYLQLGDLSVLVVEASQPEEVNLEQHGFSNVLLIDSTGVLKSEEGLSRHIGRGVTQVILTAPASSGVPTYVHGINHEQMQASDTVISAASCTTTAVATALAPVVNEFGVVHAHIETIHAYTNDQNLFDNVHKSRRRSRAGASNIVISTTGMAKALAQVLPQMYNKMTGNAVRVPVSDGSLVIASIELEKDLERNLETDFSQDRIEQVYRSAAAMSCGQLELDDSDMQTSADTVGSTAACIVDLPAMIVDKDARRLVIYAWYDNELGYARQVWRLAQHVQKLTSSASSNSMSVA